MTRPTWPELREVLTAVAVGGAPRGDDAHAVDVLVRRGLLEHAGGIQLTALGVLVLDEEVCRL